VLIPSLSNFPLAWRWTDEKYCLLPAEDLAQIIPLGAQSAKHAWEKSLFFADKNSEFSANPSLFGSIEKISSENEEFVREWLAQRMTVGNITVSWQPESAVTTNTELFIKYWNEFCYPSSDDVTIWPDNESWVVHFWHEEVFCFGRSKSV
jgi:hypothetical protein